MPITNRNYTTPQWQDNSPPPIDDSEMQAMSDTVEGNQIIVGSGAPTSATAGKIGQRYADMSATPPAIYELTEIFPSPIPQAGPYEIGGVVIGYRKNNGAIDYECRVSANENHDIYVLLQSYTNSQINLYAFCKKSNARVTAYEPVGSVIWNLQTRTTDRTWYYSQIIISWTASSAYETVMTVPAYPTFNEMLEVLDSPPTPTWQQETDPNRNLARPYSTGSSYAAGDYCIRDGKLYKAMEATSGAWDGTKWEEARLTDDLRAHEEDQDNPHEVTAAQTGAAAGSTIATVQTTNTAVRNYPAGDYFLYQGELYEVKEAVAQGGDLFAERTPDEVTVYDMKTYYPASAHNINTTSATVTVSGLSVMNYRMLYRNGFLTVVDSSAKYFYWVNTDNSRIQVVRYASDEDELKDIMTVNPDVLLYYYFDVKVQGAQYAERTGGPSNAPQKAGDLYYQTVTPAHIPNYYPFVWQDDAVMFTGTEAQLQLFLAGIPYLRKSEPAVLGDGVTALRPKTGTITLSASWSGSDPYTQAVTVSGAAVTEKSKIDLIPTGEQLAQLAADDVKSVTICNNGGRLTAYAVGAQPSGSMTVACLVEETA